MTNRTSVSIWSVDDLGHADERIGLGVLSSQVLVLIHTQEKKVTDRAAVLLTIRAGSKQAERPAVISAGEFVGAVLYEPLQFPTDPPPDLPDDVDPEMAREAMELYLEHVREGVDRTVEPPGRPSIEYPLVRPLGLPDVFVLIARWMCHLLRCRG